MGVFNGGEFVESADEEGDRYFFPADAANFDEWWSVAGIEGVVHFGIFLGVIELAKAFVVDDLSKMG